MAIVEKAVRSAVITIAALFIGLSLVGVIGVWLVDRKAVEVALKGFSLVETAAGVVDAGVARVDDLIERSRTEVRQASETVSSVGVRTQANGPVLNALSDRLDANLAPRVAQLQQALAPVRDGLAMIGNAVSLLNSIPAISDRAPRLEKLDESLNRLEELSADTTQMRATLRALAVEQRNEIAPETVATLGALTQRIDSLLSEVQASVREVRTDITALQVRLDAKKKRVLFVLNLLAVMATLMFAWMLYCQIVVIRHRRR